MTAREGATAPEAARLSAAPAPAGARPAVTASAGAGFPSPGLCTPPLFDLHCHLDFAPDAAATASALAARGMGAFSATVSPRGYERACAELASYDAVRVGVGLHPWWVADGRCGQDDVALFEQLAARTRFVGEVGLDFAPARAGAREEQAAAFGRVAAACAAGGKTVSIHAVRAAGEVLDVLEQAGALEGNACVLHWFSGTSDELQRALRAGCYCSINPRMLATRRGRAYAQAIPADRLLLETDAPAKAGAPYDVPAESARLAAMLDQLAALRRADRAELAGLVAATSRRLLFLPSARLP